MITLRMIDPERNRRQFSLIREWGRIGHHSKMLSRAFESEQKAEKALVMLKNRKIRRGYA